jgi:hypothetical protein
VTKIIMDNKKLAYLKSLLFGTISSLIFHLIGFLEDVFYYEMEAATALSQIRFFPNIVVYLVVFSVVGHFMFRRLPVSEDKKS